MPMSTFGLALVLLRLPLRSRGLDQFGSAVFIAALCMFAGRTTCIATRFLRFRWTLRALLLYPTESLYQIGRAHV